jgi:hypothetical protein
VTQWGLAARSDRLDTRVARRTIRAELRQQQHNIARAATMRVKSQEDLDRLGDELQQAGSKAWDKHSDRLARQLRDPDWDAVERAYGRVAELVSTVGEERIPPSEQQFELARKQIDDALNRLSS